MAISRMVGARIKRREDPRLITGAASYVDDIKLYDMQYIALLRSTHAHAKITRLDASKALAAPGVIAVLTGEEVRRMSAPLPTAGGVEDLKVPDHHAMPEDKVCHLGQPVAAVIAHDRYAARDALDLIEVDYEPLTSATAAAVSRIRCPCAATCVQTCLSSDCSSSCCCSCACSTLYSCSCSSGVV